MKLGRFSVAVICTALAMVATHAEATTGKPKPKPAPAYRCHSVTDPAGDANGVDPAAPIPATHAGPSEPALDILAIDSCIGQKTMLLDMQVTKLAATSPNAPTGMTWRIHFTIRKTTFTVAGHMNPFGVTFDGWCVGADGTTTTLPVRGVFDYSHNEIRVTLPVTAIAKQEPSPSNAKVTGVGGVTGQELLATQVAGSHTFDVYNAVDWTDG